MKFCICAEFLDTKLSEKSNFETPDVPTKERVLSKICHGNYVRAPNDNFRKIICSEDDLRSRIFGSFSEKFIACLPLLGFSNFKNIV